MLPPLRSILAAHLALLGSCGVLEGCSSDHDLLARKPDAETFTDDGATDRNTGGSATRETGPPRNVEAGDPERPGPWTMTWVNGVVDEEAIRICFVPIIDGRETPPAALPVPTGEGLPFGGKLVIESLPSVDLAANDLHPYLLAMSAGFDPLATCEALLAAQVGDANSAGPLSLPIIPAGTLSDRRSYLVVATGCAKAWTGGDGGPPGDKPGTAIETVCGSDPSSPNASLVLVRLSRLDMAPKLGFQVVHASAATPEATLVFGQPLGGTTLFSLGNLGFGQIAPAHEQKLISRVDLRFNAGGANVRIASSGTPAFPAVEAPLSSILAASGFDEASLDRSDSFTFVLIGARPGKAPAAPWHAFSAALVQNAPPTAANGGD